MDIVTPLQFSLVYNAFSFTFAAMAAATAFLWLSRAQVAHACRTAPTISGLVTAIAGYHYYRIFESWNAVYTFQNGVVSSTGFAFNDAYRYVDWLLTEPRRRRSRSATRSRTSSPRPGSASSYS